MGVNQQSQREEHDDLKEPRHAVHKGGYFFAEHNLFVANHHAGNVNRQVTVAMQAVGYGEGEEHAA